MAHAASGNGITKQYGLATVVSLQDERIRKMADGEIFNTITNGKNTMMAYGPNIIVPDRWAIIAYLRALQRSQNATIGDVPPEHRAELEKPAYTAAGHEKMSERSQTAPTPEGEYFESSRFAGLSFLLGVIAVGRARALRRRRDRRIRINLVFPGCLPLRFSSRSAPAASSGPLSIMRPMPNGRVVVRRQLENIAALLTVAGAAFSCRSFCCGTISTHGWTFRPESKHVARFQTRLSELVFLSSARRGIPRLFPFGGARFAQTFGATGQGWQSAFYHRDAQGVVHQSANVCALSDFRRVRLADESELPLVLNHVRRLHLCRRSGQLDVAARAGDHGFATSGLSEGCRHGGALSHHGKMDAGLLRFLGLHRLRPVHAHLVREHSGRDAVFHHSKHAIMVGVEHAAGDRALFHCLSNSAHALDQRSIRTSFVSWQAGLSACRCSTCTSSCCLRYMALAFHPSIWDLLSLIAIGATLAFVYLRLLPRTSLFPVRDPRLIESLKTVN